MSTANALMPAYNDGYDLFDEPNLTGTPERNLLLAILERAIRDYIGNTRSDARNAKEWIFEGSFEQPYVEFSFAWVCHQLDLEPERIADLIAAMPKRGEHRTAPWYFLKEDYDALVA